MARKRSNVSRGTPPPPDAESGAVGARSYMIGLFDKKDGRAADWPTIADALFRAAFDALDEAHGHETTDKLLRRVHDGAYNRIVKNEPASAGRAFSEANAPPAADRGPSMRRDFKP